MDFYLSFDDVARRQIIVQTGKDPGSVLHLVAENLDPLSTQERDALMRDARFGDPVVMQGGTIHPIYLDHCCSMDLTTEARIRVKERG